MSVWCIGTAVVDIMAFPVENGGWDEKQRIDQIRMQIGGDAANQSVRLADLGRDSKLIAAVGADQNAVLLKAALKQRGVDTSLMAVKQGISTGTAMVLVDQAGERHTFSVHGAHSLIGREDLPELNGVPDLPEAVSLASLFSIPVLERDGLLEFLMDLRECRGKGGNAIPVIADLGSDKKKQGLEGIKRFLPYIDYFLPSVYDACEMTGTSTAREAAAAYRAAGANNIVIKCGAEGVYLLEKGNDEGIMIPAPRTDVIDTTGAGDCMVAMFTDRILHGDTLQDACRYACVGATLSTLGMGACMVPVRHEQILQLLS